MSLETIFASTRRRPGLSIQFQRRQRLLRAVLPLFIKPAADAMSRAGRFSSSSTFWTKVLTPCLPSLTGGWDFERLCDDHDDLVTNCLQYLEQIVDVDKSTIASEFTSAQFPRLEVVRGWRNSNDDDGLLVGRVVKPSTPEACTRLLESLERLSKAMGDGDLQPDPEETSCITPKPKPLMAPFLHRLFQAISRHCRCACSNPHRAMLLLFTHRSTPPAMDSHCFPVFISRDTPGQNWLEMGITVNEQVPNTRVRFRLPEASRTSPPLVRVTDLCKTIDGVSQSRLNLRVDGPLLFQLGEADLEMEELQGGESVTLEEGLLGNHSELESRGRLCLGLVLSYALLDFCGEPWFPNGWTRTGIWLLQNESCLLVRPALVTTISLHSPTSHQAVSQPNDLKLLFHAILLMEVFNQAPPLDSLPLETPTEVESLRSIALHKFDNMKWDVHERYRQAVKACIDGSISGGSDCSEGSFVADFCQTVIGPLETDFTAVWGKRDPDEVLSTLRLPRVQRRARPPPTPKPSHLRAGNSRLAGLQPFVSGQTYHQPNLKFFDIVTNTDPTSIKAASQWFERFDAPHVQNKLPKRGAPKHRIKIAILDTGIDLENPWISTKSGRIQCWPPGKDCADKDGHGTQVAYLILRLAPHAQLRVVKVSESRMLRNVDIEAIKTAIEHFSTSPEDRVDIINISFGFPSFNERLQPILTAIKKARDNNVLIFAAAGNEGGNQDVCWPAKLSESGYVIRINATDSFGNSSSFNPNVETGHWICTLGEAVPSCERDAASGATVHRSGTSFATPIAVSIAAVVLATMNNTNELNVPGDLEKLNRRIRTKSGMEKVLCRTCVQQGFWGRARLSYITPWFFLGIQERHRLGIIANELQAVSE